MKLTKHQHIVPNMLLSQFAAPDGMLRVYEKNKQLPGAPGLAFENWVSST
jgi:hypothetical protein